MDPVPDPTVEVVAYSSEWPGLFLEAREALVGVLGEVVRSIEHFGSTAVVGMAAKPTIDILVVADDLGEVLARVDALWALGYTYRPDSFIAGDDRLFFRKVSNGRRTHHLHGLRTGAAEISDYRRFRDALRTNAPLAARYEQLKVRLALAHADDRPRYVSEKSRWVEEVLGSLRPTVLPERVAAGLLRRDQQVLLCHRRPDRSSYPDVWDLPGGHIEKGETPAGALQRELAEELGVHVQVPHLAWETLLVDGFEMSVFVIDEWKGEPTNTALDEHDDLRWVSSDEAADLRLAHPSYSDLLSRVAGQ